MWVKLEHYVRPYTVLYNIDTKEIMCVRAEYISLLIEFGCLPNTVSKREFYGHEGVNYFCLSDGKFLNLLPNTYKKRNDEYKSTGDIVTDLLASVTGDCGQKELESKIKEVLGRLNYDSKAIKDTLSKFRLRVPKNCELTWEELREYEGVLGDYLLVNDLRCKRLYSVMRAPAYYPFLAREFRAGEYKVDGNMVTFNDGERTSLVELAISVDDTNTYPLPAYRAALAITNEESGTDFKLIRLKEGEGTSFSPSLNYTVMHNTGYVRVYVPSEYNDCYIALEKVNFEYNCLCTDTMTLKKIDSHTFYKMSSDVCKDVSALHTAWHRNCVVERPSHCNAMIYVCISRIKVTEKGYDIQVVGYLNHHPTSDRVARTFYSIPLICSGLVAEQVDEGYVIKLALQEVTISKTIYENLVCVGNGSVLFKTNQKKKDR